MVPSFSIALSVLALTLIVALPLTASADWLREAARSPVKTFDGSASMNKSDADLDRRGKVVVRRTIPECFSDWNTDPTALPYLFYQLRERTDGKFQSYVDNEGLQLGSDEIFDYPIIYFTSHYAFTFTDDEVENLQKYLARGGTLWLDDCTGSGPFMDAVPANLQRLAPGSEARPMMRSSERYFDFFTMVYDVPALPKLKESFMKPFQAVDVNGRPAIIFCPNDYGCHWEVSTPPTALNPLGNPAHAEATPNVQATREQIYQLCINWLFYTLTH